MKTFSSSTVTLADPVICCGREWRASRRDREKRPDPSRRIALPGGLQADWQQWDSFLTNVVKKLGADFQPALRDTGKGACRIHRANKARILVGSRLPGAGNRLFENGR